jgi:hypothetical protein
MLSRGVKPIVGLLVLLAWPCLGWGGRAEAGFLRGVALAPRQSVDPLAGESQTFAGGENEGQSDMAPPLVGGEDAPAPAPGGPNRTPASPRDLLLVFGGSPGGMSSRGGPTEQTGWGATGQPFVQPYVSPVPDADASVLLPPGDECLAPPLAKSRHFRPPRVV